MVDEVTFIAERLDDPVAAGAAQSITIYVAARLRRPSWDGTVTIDGD
ncbi:MAG: hypothetical protein ABWY81_05440 [Jiangellaceae bacterium]